MRVYGIRSLGPSIKYVTLFLANFDPLPCHTLSHIPGPPKKYVTHLGPPIFTRPSTKTRTKSLCANSLSIVRGGFCLGAIVRGSFVWKLLSRVISHRFLDSPTDFGLLVL